MDIYLCITDLVHISNMNVEAKLDFVHTLLFKNLFVSDRLPSKINYIWCQFPHMELNDLSNCCMIGRIFNEVVIFQEKKVQVYLIVKASVHVTLLFPYTCDFIFKKRIMMNCLVREDIHNKYSVYVW